MWPIQFSTSFWWMHTEKSMKQPTCFKLWIQIDNLKLIHGQKTLETDTFITPWNLSLEGVLKDILWGSMGFICGYILILYCDQWKIVTWKCKLSYSVSEKTTNQWKTIAWKYIQRYFMGLNELYPWLHT
jgi:hypothetical protein